MFREKFPGFLRATIFKSDILLCKSAKTCNLKSNFSEVTKTSNKKKATKSFHLVLHSSAIFMRREIFLPPRAFFYVYLPIARTRKLHDSEFEFFHHKIKDFFPLNANEMVRFLQKV